MNDVNWGDLSHTARLLEILPAVERQPLVGGHFPDSSGVYLHYLCLDGGDEHELVRTNVLPALGSLWCGETAVNVGAAKSLRERAGRYRAAWAGHEALLQAVQIAYVRTPNYGWALLAEWTLLQEVAPAFKGTGWGNKRPGSGRPGGARRRKRVGDRGGNSVADALFFPGRSWVREVAPMERLQAQVQVLSWLGRSIPPSRRA